jgi:hypothetical protein
MSVEQIAGQYQATPQAFADGQTIAVQVDSHGNLRTGTGSVADGIPVAASQTNYALQTTAGAAGDYLAVLMIVPGNTSPGAVTFKDGTGGASITAFPGGANSVAVLAPFPFVVNARSVDGAWSVTTGANVTVWASGEFS